MLLSDEASTASVLNSPQFQAAVDARILEMLQTGALLDLMAQLQTGNAPGVQSQEMPPQDLSQFDKTDTRLTQLVRFKRPTNNDDVLANKFIWEILLPGSESKTDETVEPPKIVMQNGNLIPIASGELERVNRGPWWKILNVSEPVETTALLGIYAIVVPDVGGTSDKDWPVSGSNAALKFKRDGNSVNGIDYPDLITACQPGIERGLKWQIAAIDADTINVKKQFTLGHVIHSSMMGDGDANNVTSDQAATASSIVRQRNGVYQLVNIGMSPMANDASKPMVIVDTVDGKLITKLMDQSDTVEKMGDADADSPSQLSIHTRGSGDFEIKNFDTAPVNPILAAGYQLPATTVAAADATDVTKYDAVVGRKYNTNGKYEVKMLKMIGYAPDPVNTHEYINLGPHQHDDDQPPANGVPGYESWSFEVDGYGGNTSTWRQTNSSDKAPRGFKKWDYILTYNPYASIGGNGFISIYWFYRISYHDAAGRLQKIETEVREEWTIGEPL